VRKQRLKSVPVITTDAATSGTQSNGDHKAPAAPRLEPTPVPHEFRPRDADRSQKAILDAAKVEFAEHGLGGARVQRIAERAPINKQLIYYYFKSKEHLFVAVLEDIYSKIREAEKQLALDQFEPVVAIRRLTEFTWQYYLDHPEMLTLINSENLHRAKHLKKSKTIRERNSPLLSMLGQVLERGRVEGTLRGGIDPLQLYITITGLGYVYLSNNHTLSTIFGRNLMSPKALNERLAHVLDVVMAYVVREP